MPARSLRILLAAAVVTVGAFATTARADVTLTQTARPTDLAAGSGLVVFSAYDAQSNGYRLMQIRAGAVSAVPVAPSPTPFDADVGPTSSGHAYLVYQRCADAGANGQRGCDIYTFNPATGRELRSRASDPNSDDLHPTYWKGRLVFARDYGPKVGRQIVYQRPNGSTSRSLRVPGLPARRCLKGRCLKVSGLFTDLELYGSHLAEAASSNRPASYQAGAEEDLAELRLVDVTTGRSQQLSDRGQGESGQTWIGTSFDRGRLYAYFTCQGDTSGCKPSNAGAYRYRYATGDWALSGSDQPLGGFAVADGDTYEEAVNDAQECGAVDAKPGRETPCQIVRKVPDLTYTDSGRP